jgi:signal transduction histidine kinase
MERTKVTVLAIEDDPGDVQLLRRYLEDILGWEVKLLAFTEPAEGLAQLADHAPDIVLLDYLLGATTGLEVLKRIQRCGCKCPVVILTGCGTEELAAELMRYGAADYLTKNQLSAASLKRVIANAIAKYKLQEALEEHRRRLQEINQDLFRKNEEIQNFYHMVSHELTSPLTSAREYVTTVLNGTAGPLNDKQHRFLEIARESCDQMCVYVDDLLDVTRLQTEKFAVHPSSVSVDKLVHQVVASIFPTAQEKGIHLKHIIEPDLPEVNIDEARINQVLSNLLNNALKFTPKGGQIMVQVADNPGAPEFLIVSVTDNGLGIERDKLPYIFDRLYQATSNDWETHRGMGLGLYICRELVRLHRGDIWVQSEPGKGSTFSFTIPKCTPEETSDAVTVMEREDALQEESPECD